MTTREVARQAHAELANIFFGEASEDTDEVTSSHSDTKAAHTPPDVISSRPSNATPWADVSYSVRHVEESWHHLMRSEDTDKLKTIAVCNFDFLLAAVSAAKLQFLLPFYGAPLIGIVAEDKRILVLTSSVAFPCYCCGRPGSNGID